MCFCQYNAQMDVNSKINILMVEDTEEDIDLFKLKFSKLRLPHELILVSKGEDALEYLEKNYPEGRISGPPVIILLDLQLPGLNGIETLREIRANAYWSEIPIIILTSSDKQQDLVSAYKTGATLLMRKPFQENLFLDIINHLRITGRINPE